MNKVHLQYETRDASLVSATKDPNAALSQVDEALVVHAKLLSDLSEELIHTRNRFYGVLMPDVPTSCENGTHGAEPILSPLAEAIVDQSHLVRTMLRDLRNINSRCAV